MARQRAAFRQLRHLRVTEKGPARNTPETARSPSENQNKGRRLITFLKSLSLQCLLVSPNAGSARFYEENNNWWYQNLVSKFKELRFIFPWREEPAPRAGSSFAWSVEYVETDSRNEPVKSSLHFSSRSPPDSVNGLLMHNCFREPSETARTVGACSPTPSLVRGAVAEILRR